MEMDDPQYWEMLIKRSLSRFFMLSALAQGPRHGYELRKAVYDCCAGCCEPSAAAIYPAIRELLDGGYVECRTEVVGARERKVCTLTEKGFHAYRVASEAWSKVVPSLAEATGQAMHPQTEKGSGTEGQADGHGCRPHSEA